MAERRQCSVKSDIDNVNSQGKAFCMLFLKRWICQSNHGSEFHRILFLMISFGLYDSTKASKFKFI